MTGPSHPLCPAVPCRLSDDNRQGSGQQSGCRGGLRIWRKQGSSPALHEGGARVTVADTPRRATLNKPLVGGAFADRNRAMPNFFALECALIPPGLDRLRSSRGHVLQGLPSLPSDPQNSLHTQGEMLQNCFSGDFGPREAVLSCIRVRLSSRAVRASLCDETALFSYAKN